MGFWVRFGAATVARAFWDVVLGSGYRATINALGAARAEQVRAGVIGQLALAGTTAVRTDVVYGVATRPAAGTG